MKFCGWKAKCKKELEANEETAFGVLVPDPFSRVAHAMRNLFSILQALFHTDHREHKALPEVGLLQVQLLDEVGRRSAVRLFIKAEGAILLPDRICRPFSSARSLHRARFKLRCDGRCRPSNRCGGGLG